MKIRVPLLFSIKLKQNKTKQQEKAVLSILCLSFSMKAY